MRLGRTLSCCVAQRARWGHASPLLPSDDSGLLRVYRPPSLVEFFIQYREASVREYPWQEASAPKSKCKWHLFRQDFRIRCADNVAEQLALLHLQEYLVRSGRTTADYGLPLSRAFDADAYGTCELRAERNYDPGHEESEAARSYGDAHA